MQVFTMFGFKKYYSMNMEPSLSHGKYRHSIARPAPEAGSLVSRSFESTMLTGGMGGDSELNEWALNFHNMLIPPPPVLPTHPPQSQGMSAAEVKLMVLEEFKKKGSGESTSRGCRKMKDEEFKLMLSIGGHPLDTPRDNAPPFVKVMGGYGPQ